MVAIKFEAKQMEEFSYTPGEYIGLIDSITPGKSKSGTKHYAIALSGEGFGKITHFLYNTVFGQAELYQIYTALGIDPNRNDVDDSELIDNYIAFTIEEDGEYKGKPRIRVTNFRAVEDSTIAKDEEDDDDDW